MTDIPITAMVKCPMLFEHDPCDLIPVGDCNNCLCLKRRYTNKVVCTWGEQG